MTGLSPVRLRRHLGHGASFKPRGEQESLALQRAKFPQVQLRGGTAFLQTTNPLPEKVSAAPGSPQALHHLLALSSGSSGGKRMKQPPSIRAGSFNSKWPHSQSDKALLFREQPGRVIRDAHSSVLRRPGPRAPEYSLAHSSGVSEGASGKICWTEYHRSSSPKCVGFGQCEWNTKQSKKEFSLLDCLGAESLVFSCL